MIESKPERITTSTIIGRLTLIVYKDIIIITLTSSIYIVSMHLLAYVESTMWGYFEALLSPVLSDSFGFSINMTAYVFLAFSVPKIFGSLLV